MRTFKIYKQKPIYQKMKTNSKKLQSAHERHDYWVRRRSNAYTERELNYSREMEKRALAALYKIMEEVK